MILLADEANATKKGGQELIGGLAVRVRRNHFGRQIESFITDLDLPFLADGAATTNGNGAAAKYQGVFIRAPIVEEVLKPATDGGKDSAENVEVLAVLPGRVDKAAQGEEGHAGDIVAVRQGNILGMSFHPELTADERIHAWWLRQVIEAVEKR